MRGSTGTLPRCHYLCVITSAGGVGGPLEHYLGVITSVSLPQLAGWGDPLENYLGVITSVFFVFYFNYTINEFLSDLNVRFMLFNFEVA